MPLQQLLNHLSSSLQIVPWHRWNTELIEVSIVSGSFDDEDWQHQPDLGHAQVYMIDIFKPRNVLLEIAQIKIHWGVPSMLYENEKKLVYGDEFSNHIRQKVGICVNIMDPTTNMDGSRKIL
jgi:hypothetical protein